MRRKIPWSLNISPEVYIEYTGVKSSDYYTDPEVTMYVQIEGGRIFSELFGMPVRRRVHPAGTSYVAASMLGAEVIFPERHPPEIRGRRIKSIADFKTVKLGEPRESGLIPTMLSHYEYMKNKTAGSGIQAGLGFGGAQGPFTTAVVLRGMDMFTDIILYPDECKTLLNTCAGANMAIIKLAREISGEKPDAIWVGDDYSGLISPEMYGEFSYPYLQMVYECVDVKRRVLHSETLKKGHLKYFEKLKIDFYDPGINDNLSVKDILEATDADFSYNLFTVRDMMNGTPASIRAKYLEIIGDGAPFVTAEISPGTPRENVLAYVGAARENE